MKNSVFRHSLLIQTLLVVGLVFSSWEVVAEVARQSTVTQKAASPQNQPNQSVQPSAKVEQMSEEQLENLYREGVSFFQQKQYPKALEFWKKAAANNETKSAYNLAWMYENGYGTNKNLALAFETYLKLAEQEHNPSQYKVGTFYFYGVATQRDIEKAIYWIRKAAQANHPKALHLMGVFYDDGHGVERNATQAFSWYEKAAEAGNESDMLVVAQFYEAGEVVNKNLAKAEYWYQQAYQNKVQDADIYLAQFYKNNNQPERAIEVVNNSPNKDNPRMQLFLDSLTP